MKEFFAMPCFMGLPLGCLWLASGITMLLRKRRGEGDVVKGLPEIPETFSMAILWFSMAFWGFVVQKRLEMPTAAILPLIAINVAVGVPYLRYFARSMRRSLRNSSGGK